MTPRFPEQLAALNRWDVCISFAIARFASSTDRIAKRLLPAFSQLSGGGRESNPPGSFRPHTSFEDRGAHQEP